MTAFVLLATLLGVCAFALLTRRAWRRSAGGAPTDATAAERPSKRLLGSLATLLFVVVAGGYAWLGSPRSLALAPGETAAAGGKAGEPTPEAVAAVIESLVARLKERPSDAAAWGLLARSYVAIGRHADAVGAFQKALELRQYDADLLVDYADAIAVNNGRNLDGEPARLVERALAVDPNHVKALVLSGLVAFNRQDYAGALQSWDKAAPAIPPDSPLAAQLRSGIAQARQLAGAGSAGDAANRVSGTVTLAPALAARTAPEDTVFVFARAAQGSRMPLAVLRKQVRDLPIEFVLDDSLAMSPAAKLSAAPRLVVGARISKSGTALPQPGDLQGTVGPVDVGAAGLKIEIGEVVAK